MKYILFEKSAVEKLINYPELQSPEFDLGASFISFLKGDTHALSLNGIVIRAEKDGLIFAGSSLSKTFLLIDSEKCPILQQTSNYELLTILQKLFRFSIRFWNKLAFTSCEKILKTKAVVFPFPFSAGAAFHIVVKRNPEVQRLQKRGIEMGLLAYKYDNASTFSLDKEPDPDYGIYQSGGEAYISLIPELRRTFDAQKDAALTSSPASESINIVESCNLQKVDGFKYMPFCKQLDKLTTSQKKVVNYESTSTPIKVEGPAGTGKTASLILRAVRLLESAKKTGTKFHIVFLTHSKSTEEAVRTLILDSLDSSWLDPSNPQYIQITTLLTYCAEYTGISQNSLTDQDAFEAKQNQLFLIQEAYETVKMSSFETYKFYLSDKTRTYFESEDTIKIILMLQHEFSIRIKGVAEGSLEKYKKTPALQSGIPLITDDDKEYVFRIYRAYQDLLASLSVYDTDDVILEALARFNAPLWRRNRLQMGFDYIFADEMHLFNLNEQQIFHFLTKDPEQKTIPICFALDYSQAIGERGDIKENYFEKEFENQHIVTHEYSTVFRSSQQIAELCASITASGAMLFQNFSNPYKNCQSGFTASKEQLCDSPKLYMYENDTQIIEHLHEHVKTLINQNKWQPYEIAIITFDNDLIDLSDPKLQIGGYDLQIINSKNSGDASTQKRKLVFSYPEYINGLEFKAVILLGVDEGRVPQSGIVDISNSFLRYSALNKLYLVCSRAQYSVIMLGSQARGQSECLNHSIATGTLTVVAQ